MPRAHFEKKQPPVFFFFFGSPLALARVETRAQGHEGQAPLLLLIFENII